MYKVIDQGQGKEKGCIMTLDPGQVPQASEASDRGSLHANYSNRPPSLATYENSH